VMKMGICCLVNLIGYLRNKKSPLSLKLSGSGILVIGFAHNKVEGC
jgi:hypothetical protein